MMNENEIEFDWMGDFDTSLEPWQDVDPLGLYLDYTSTLYEMTPMNDSRSSSSGSSSSSAESMESIGAVEHVSSGSTPMPTGLLFKPSNRSICDCLKEDPHNGSYIFSERGQLVKAVYVEKTADHKKLMDCMEPKVGQIVVVFSENPLMPHGKGPQRLGYGWQNDGGKKDVKSVPGFRYQYFKNKKNDTFRLRVYWFENDSSKMLCHFVPFDEQDVQSNKRKFDTRGEEAEELLGSEFFSMSLDDLNLNEFKFEIAQTQNPTKRRRIE
eukprot:TRINITY_DN16329_c0_g1_i1.p1 TRINITY_DN16329_c0_g1~~TRINITY_DN16329_c0_g1_i1.p1  ORF type:complete len:268 (-),score=83.22 TRINITY_DN16329_c0_g1_i1:237-1040(-)